MSVNKAILLGYLGQDPKILTTKDGKEIAHLSLATTESWKDKNGEKKSVSEWHKIVVFSQGLVGVIKSYVKKGSKLYIEGSLKTREWKDKQDIKHYTTEIVLQGFDSKLIILDSKQDTVSKRDSQLQNHEKQFDDIANNFDLDDNIPF